MLQQIIPRSNFLKSRLFLITALVLSFLFFYAPKTIAANCSPSPAGDEVIFSSCSFPGLVNGVDAGNLTINPGATLTISNGQTIIWNSGKSLTLNGSLVLIGNGKLVKSNLWMADGDGDGWSSNSTQVYDSSATKPGYTRRSSIRSLGTVDCNDSALSVDNLCPYPPTATTVGATNITITSATLNGSGNPGNVATTGYFRYATTNPGTCNDTFGTRVPLVDGSVLGSGNSSVAYSQVLDGILPETTYYFCAITSNAEGVGFGQILGFVTQSIEIPLFPVVATTPATNTTTTSSTLNGSASAGGANATAYFRYSAVNPTLCNDTFGTRAPTSGGTSIAMGGQASFTRSVTGLIPNTEYYFCAIASNVFGTGTGSLVAFITPANVPIVTTNPATLVTGTTATLNGSANPNTAETTGYFRYATVSPGTCNDTFGTPTAISSLGSGSSAANYSQAVSQLAQLTTYYYCAIAINSGGTGFGAVLSFFTWLPPFSVTTSVSTVGSITTFNGNADPNGASTTGYFRYSIGSSGTCNDSLGTRVPSSGGSSLGSGTSAVNYSQNVSGLIPSTQYHFCAIANNSQGTGFGQLVFFITPNVPTFGGGSYPYSITSTSAILRGWVNPNGASATGYFRYSTTNPGTCNDTFVTRVPSSGGTALGSGTLFVSYTESISGLTPLTTYYFCPIASNSQGTGFDSVLGFYTWTSPTTTTSSASSIMSTTATLNGTVNPNGDSTVAYFRYSTTNPGTCNDTFGTQTLGSSLGSGTSAVPYSQAISGLSGPNVTYYFCAIASNSQGISFGSVLSFTTISAPTVATSPATSVTATQATLNGSVNPNSVSTTAWFRYSATNPGTCSNAFGTITSTTSLGSGTSAVLYSSNISGLSSGVTYYFCSIAQNSVGISFGSMLSFLAPAIPTVTTLPFGFADTMVTKSATLPSGRDNLSCVENSLTKKIYCFGGYDGLSYFNQITEYDATSDTLTTKSAVLPSARAYFSCSENSITNKIYCFGGWDGSSYLSQIIEYNPATDTISTKSAVLPSGRRYLSCSENSLTNKIYCFGGYNSTTTNFNQIVEYNPATDTIVTKSAVLPSARRSLSCSENSGTHKIYCFGGFDGSSYFNQIVEYNPATDTIVTKSATLPSERADFSCSENSLTNKIYCFGGYTSGYSNQIVEYDSSNNTINIKLAILPSSRLGLSCSENSLTNKIYCFGGFNGSDTNQIVEYTSGDTFLGSANPRGATTTGWFRYSNTNPGSCNDTFGARVPSSGGTSLGLGTSAVAYGQSKSGFIVGPTYYYCAIAQNSVGKGYGSISSFIYKAAPIVSTVNYYLDTIAVKSATLPFAREALSCAGYPPTQKIYCFGGYNGSYTNQIVEYDPVTDTIAIKSATLPSVRSKLSCTYMQYSGTIYCAGGYNGSVFSNQIIEYNPSNNTLTIKSAVLPTSRNLVSCADGGGSGGNLFCLGGYDGNFLSQIVQYNIQGNNVLIPSATLPSTREALSCVKSGITSELNIYCFGGYNGSYTNQIVAYYQGFVTTRSATLPAGIKNLSCAQNSSTLKIYCFGGYTGVVSNQIIEYNPSGDIATTKPNTLPSYRNFHSCAENSATNKIYCFGGWDGNYLSQITEYANIPSFNGSANPRGASTTGYFRYSTTNPGTCNDTFGTRYPSSGGVSLGSVDSSVAYTQSISGLSSGTTYYFCAIANNSQGTAFGSVLSFFTAPGPIPIVTTSSASSVTSTTATLNGSANPNNAATAGWFRYSTTNPGTCNDTFGTRAPSSGGTSLGSGGSTVDYSQNISGLSIKTTYYFCAIANNSQGTAFGSVLSFFTPGMPIVTGTYSDKYTTASLASTFPYKDSSCVENSLTNKIYCFGGYAGSFSDQIIEYNPATNTSITKPARLPSPRDGLSCVENSATHKIYCFGGYKATSPYYLNEIFEYDNVVSYQLGEYLLPKTATLPSGLTDLSCAENSATHKIYCFGGYDGSFSRQIISEYDPSAPDTGLAVTTKSATLPSGRDDLSCVENSTAHNIYCFGGNSATGLLSQIVAYNTALNSVTILSSTLPTSRSGLSCAEISLAQKIYCFGGNGGSSYQLVEYSYENNEIDGGWGFSERMEPSCATNSLTNKIYCLGGGVAGGYAGDLVEFDTTYAIFIGYANPNGAETTGWFRYSVSTGTCSGTFGTKVPSTNIALGSGTSDFGYYVSVTGLTPGVTYYFCAIASNSYGTDYGSITSHQQ